MRIWDLRRGDADDNRTSPAGGSLRSVVLSAAMEFNYLQAAIGFLALVIGLIACDQGLATQGGAAAVGARTTTAVVLAIFGVIVVNALFTLFYALMGI